MCPPYPPDIAIIPHIYYVVFRGTLRVLLPLESLAWVQLPPPPTALLVNGDFTLSLSNILPLQGRKSNIYTDIGFLSREEIQYP